MRRPRPPRLRGAFLEEVWSVKRSADAPVALAPTAPSGWGVVASLDTLYTASPAVSADAQSFARSACGSIRITCASGHNIEAKIQVAAVVAMIIIIIRIPDTQQCLIDSLALIILLNTSFDIQP